MRYVDADNLKSIIEKATDRMVYINGVKAVDMGAIIGLIDRQPTAEVVPKSECDECQERVLKDFDDLRDFYRKQIDYLLSKNDELKQENETLKDNNEHLAVLLEEAKQAYANYEETTGLKQAKQEVAREIFADFKLKAPFFCENQIAYDHFNEELAELEKKYTEGD